MPFPNGGTSVTATSRRSLTKRSGWRQVPRSMAVSALISAISSGDDQDRIEGFAAAPGGGETDTSPRMVGALLGEVVGELSGCIRRQRRGAADGAQPSVFVVAAEDE